MFDFQKIRGFLFYFCVLLFIIGLPLILAFALGYKFNTRTFKFVKTGIILIKTQPPGARIYLNGVLLEERTPASLQELLPGAYDVGLELAQHYSWSAEVEVEAGKLSRVDKVILFPQRPDLKQLNQEKFSAFSLDNEKRLIYYLDLQKGLLYRSQLDGSGFEDIAGVPESFDTVSGWEVSPDQSRFFVYNQRRLAVIAFEPQIDADFSVATLSLEYPQEKISDVFWHSDSYHLIVLTDKHVQVVESRRLAVPVNLVELNRGPSAAYYDRKEDVLYFSNSQRDSEGIYNNLYKLELNADLYFLEKLIIQPLEAVLPAQKEERVE